MRRRLFCALMMTTLLLSLAACGELSAEEELQGLREQLSEAGSFRFVADLRADYGKQVYDFRVRFADSGEGGTVTILEPETVAGAAVRFDRNGTALSFEGAEVYTGELLPQGLSPVDALPMIAAALRSGLVTGCVRERYGGTDALEATYMIDESVTLRVWFDRGDGLPVAAEISFEGYTVLTASFYDFTAE